MSTHAIVVGGGIGGLLAGPTLLDHFDRVTILERDRYPSTPAPRRGVAQSRCPHLLMAGGLDAFDRLAPGWRADAVARGARAFDLTAESALRLPAGWLPRTPSETTLYGCTRELLEGVLRRRASARPRVDLRTRAAARGLLWAGQRVVGVDLETGPLKADLVVDAAGLGSALPQWLTAAGHGPVRESRVDSAARYVSQWFVIAPEHRPPWRLLATAPVGDDGRSAMMIGVEHDRWGVILLDRSADALPHSDESFRAFAGGLAEGQLARALLHAQPDSPVHRYGRTENRLRHYEALEEWPAGLVALGDGVCALDPYFGLGMTQCARGVLALSDWLDAGGGSGFQASLAARNADAWRLTTGSGITADPHYLNCIFALAPDHPFIARRILEVSHALAPVEALSSSDMVARVHAAVDGWS